MKKPYIYINKGVRIYLKQVSKISKFSSKENKELMKKIKRGDGEARTRLIRANQRLVISVAKKYRNKGIPFLDLISGGNIGLITAIEKYNLSRRTKFSSYAHPWIKGAICELIRNQSLIKFPDRMKKNIYKYKKCCDELRKVLYREPTIKEIAKKMDKTIEKTQEIQKWATTETVPLEEKYIASKSKLPSHEVGASPLLKEATPKILSVLTDRDKEIFRLRFGISNGKPHTLSETGKKLGGVSREAIRKMEIKALRKLRDNSKSAKELKKI